MAPAKRTYGMTMRQPATRWEDALPCGNGSIGALIYGNIVNETIILNHEALFIPGDKPKVPDVSKHLPELRRLLAEGNYKAASDFIGEKMNAAGAKFVRPEPYQPAFDIDLTMPTKGAFTDYERSVDFTTGEGVVKWKDGDATFRRELFVSRTDDAVVYRIRASRKASITCSIGLIPHGARGAMGMGSGKDVKPNDAPITFTPSSDKNGLAIVARYENGNEYAGAARVVVKGGEHSIANGRISITKADEVLVLVKIAPNQNADKAVRRTRRELKALPDDYGKLLKGHVKQHGEIFMRMNIDLTAGRRDDVNEQLLLDAYNGEVPQALMEKMFDYGRYLLVCSSPPNGMPANLQGVWNGDYNPAWASDYHNDENIQMNYWQALPGNMPETTLPYFDYYDSFVKDYQFNAKAIYGARGIFVPIAQTTHGLMAYPGPWVNWTAGAGWLAQLYYDYWLFTGDRDFLKKRAVPFMKQVALFYEDFLIDDGTGTLMFSPSLSPENVPAIPNGSLATVNATMDVAIAREVLANLCEACELLGIEKAGTSRWKAIFDKLPAYEINEDGAIREWIHPELRDNYHHRHQSHIYPLFPGFEVTKESNPKLFKAMRIAVEKRLVVGLASQSGWSLAHMANIYARLGDGNRALECLELLSRSCVGPNLFTYHNDWRGQGMTLWWGGQPPFQIDANFGLTAAVLEMLAFSVPGMIKLLPALPDKWPAGRADGMLCRGGVVLSVEWDIAAGRVNATFRSETAQEITVAFPGEVKSVRTSSAVKIGKSESGGAYRVVQLPANRSITITANLA